MTTHTYKTENGAMTEVPCYETHRRGRNWMAIISPDPSAPGGLAREFVDRGRGKYYYLVDETLVDQPIEIAADYFSTGGNRSPKRWYGVVRSLTDSEITIQHYETSDEAIAAAQAGPDQDALLEERERLLARLAEIDATLDTLRRG